MEFTQGSPPEIGAEVIIGTRRLVVAVAALTLYEYAITFKYEVALVWQRKFSIASLILVLLRCTLLVSAIFVLLPPPAVKNCSSRTVMVLIPILLGYILTSVFSALRVFAIWNHDSRIFAIVIALQLISGALNAVLLHRNMVPMTFVGPKIYICNDGRLPMGGENYAFALGTRMPVLLAEFLVLALTWVKTYRSHRDAWRLGIASSLATCLIRDGSMYFLLLLLNNIAQLVIMTHPSTITAVTPFLDIMPPILTSRFIINLRRAATHVDVSDVSSQYSRESVSAPRFRAWTEELGNPLDVPGFAGADHEIETGDDTIDIELTECIRHRTEERTAKSILEHTYPSKTRDT